MRRWFATWGIIIILLPLLSACGASYYIDRFFFSPEYAVAGLDGDPALNEKISAALEARAESITLARDPADRARQESEEETAIAAELAERLRAEGYYDAAVTYRDGDTAWQGRYEIAAGAVYTIARLEVSPRRYRDALAKTSLRKKQPLAAEAVLAAGADLYRVVHKDKCFFSLDVSHEVLLDTRRKTADVTFTVAAARETVFGETVFEGNGSVDSAYLQKLVPWRAGDCFDRAKIERLKAALFESGLFSGVAIILPDRAPPRGRPADIRVVVKERAHRSISAGISYYSDEGPGLTLGWSHRNLFGGAEKFESLLKLSTLTQNLSASFDKPFFGRDDQSLSLSAQLGREDSEAYVKYGLEAGAALRRRFTPHLSASTGVALSLTRIEDNANAVDATYGLVSLPQTVTYDRRNSLLDPTRGWLVEAAAEPFLDAMGEADPFIKATLAARAYLGLGDATVLALRARLGSIMGSDTVSVPADERFYAGGGGSVRGFAYQDIGPRGAGNDPAGGRGLAEASAELRFRFDQDIGAVAFIDAGSVTGDAMPDVSELSVGAGLGLRYYTAAGPVRFDVGVPVNDRNSASGDFQVYISLGQAF